MISDAILKGNYGEQYVAGLLAEHKCLVRHVSQGMDSGIDLYCEHVLKGQPYIHFFVQVKTGSFCNENEVIQKRAYGKWLDYWQKQPAPVFIFLVKDNKQINIYSIRQLPEIKKPIIKIIKINDSRIDRFLKDILIKECFSWSLMQGGFLFPIKKSGNGIRKYFVGLTTEYSKKIKRNICTSLWRIADDIMRNHINYITLRPKKNMTVKRCIEETEHFINTLEIIVKREKNSNPGYLVTIGILNELKGINDTAYDYYKRAIRKLKNGDFRIKKYSRHLQRVERKLSR